MNRQEWLEKRHNFITASDVPAIMGLSKYRSPIEVWNEKVNGHTDENIAPAAEIGLDIEPVLVRKVGTILKCEAVWLGENLDVAFKVHPHYEYIAATIDGLATLDEQSVQRAEIEFPTDDIKPGTYIIECKTTSKWDGKEDIPQEWVAQCQTQMAVHGIDGVILIVLVMGYNRHYELRFIPFDKSYWDDHILPKIVEFWTYVQTETLPPVTSPDDVDIIKSIYPNVNDMVIEDNELEDMIDRLNQLKEQRNTLDTEIALLEGELRRKGENYKAILAGKYVVDFALQNRKETVIPAKTIKVMRIKQRKTN